MDEWSTYQLGANGLSYINQHYDKWKKYDAGVCASAMVVCAICGFTVLSTYDPLTDSHDFSKFVDAEVPIPDLAFRKSAPHLHDNMHVLDLGDNTAWCKVCKECECNANQRKEHVVNVPMSYMQCILTAPLRYMQAMSVVNVHLNLTRRLNGFYSGFVGKISLFHAPLIVTDEARYENDPTLATPSIVEEILDYNMQFMTSLYRRYKPFVERSLDSLRGFPAVSSATVHRIIARSIGRDPHLTTQCPNDDDDNAVEPIDSSTTSGANNVPNPAINQNTTLPTTHVRTTSTVVFDECLNDPAANHDENDRSTKRGTANVLLGEAYSRNEDVAERVYVESDGRNVAHASCGCEGGSSACACNLTAESGTMPFLFPEGSGHYDGNMSLSKYLNLRFLAPFTAFTCYSPYLIIMYMISRTHQLGTATTQACLKKDFMKARAAEPWLSETELLTRVVRRSIPRSIAGSPLYHKQNLDDLLCACSEEYLSMPTGFITLTADEFSRTRWSSYTNLDHIMRAIRQTLSWRDAPVECARVFRARAGSPIHEMPHSTTEEGKGSSGNSWTCHALDCPIRSPRARIVACSYMHLVGSRRC